MAIHYLMVDTTQEYRVGDRLLSSITNRLCFRSRLKKPPVRRKIVQHQLNNRVPTTSNV